MYEALDLLATLPDSASQIVEAKIGDSRSALFIEQIGNWVHGATQDHTLAFSLAIPDRSAIRHVIDKLQHLLRGKDEIANPFCTEFGVIDDD